MKAGHKWLNHPAKNAPQLDLEMPELWSLLAWRPSTSAHRLERDRWVLQLLCGRRYEDLEKLDPRQYAALPATCWQKLVYPWGVASLNWQNPRFHT